MEAPCADCSARGLANHHQIPGKENNSFWINSFVLKKLIPKDVKKLNKVSVQ